MGEFVGQFPTDRRPARSLTDDVETLSHSGSVPRGTFFPRSVQEDEPDPPVHEDPGPDALLPLPLIEGTP